MQSALGTCVLGLIICALVLGGATRTGYSGDVVVQLLSVPLLLAVAWSRSIGAAKPPLSYWFLIAAWLALGIGSLSPVSEWLIAPELPSTLEPLPQVLATETPGSEFSMTGPSLALQRSWSTWLAFLPAIAVFGAACLLSHTQRARITKGLLIFGAVSLLLGLMQLAQGPGSILRLFDVTNRTEAVGFFANRNHFATLLSVILVLAGAWLVQIMMENDGKQWLRSRSFLSFCLAATLMVAIVGGLAMARSRAGMLMGLMALIGIVAIMVTRQVRQRSVGRTHLVAGASIFSIVFTLQFSLERILTRFEQDPLKDLRIPILDSTWHVAFSHLPFGTGLGTFPLIYSIIEGVRTLGPSFVNHAHNDPLEFVLEAGLIAIAILAGFAIWLSNRTLAAWTGRFGRSDVNEVHMARAATIIVALIVAQSFVDYPLRTTALAIVFAFACALLVPPPEATDAIAAAPPFRCTSRSGSPQFAPAQHRPYRPVPISGQPESSAPRHRASQPSFNLDEPWPQAWTSLPPKANTPHSVTPKINRSSADDDS
jgi:O-antigen ligase